MIVPTRSTKDIQDHATSFKNPMTSPNNFRCVHPTDAWQTASQVHSLRKLLLLLLQQRVGITWHHNDFQYWFSDVKCSHKYIKKNQIDRCRMMQIDVDSNWISDDFT